MTVFNTINKLKTKPIGKLQGLKISIIECSYRDIGTTVNIKNQARETLGFNNFNDIKRRNFNELDGLYINVLEKSKVEKLTNLYNIKFVRPLKTYKANIKLILKYKTNIK